jgi:hypothetical protein
MPHSIGFFGVSWKKSFQKCARIKPCFEEILTESEFSTEQLRNLN